MKYKILGSTWFTANKRPMMACIGIVAVDSDGRGWKCYIGLGKGDDQETDEQRIAMWGSHVGKAIALAAFPNLKEDEYLN